MSNVKISNLPASSGISNDDLLIIVDDPSGIPSTKKITRYDLFKPIIKLFDQPLPITIHDLDHENADILMFNLDNSPLISGYLSLTGMKAGYDGQRVTIFNISNSGYGFLQGANNFPRNLVNDPFKSILFFNEVLGSGSLEQNRFRINTFTGTQQLNYNEPKGQLISPGTECELMYSNHFKKWTLSISNADNFTYVLSNSPGSVGGGGV